MWQLSFKANLSNPKRITNFFVFFNNPLQTTSSQVKPVGFTVFSVNRGILELELSLLG
jgi:hypothetical protein